MKLYEITDQFYELLGNEDLTEEEYNELGNKLALALKDKSTDIVGFYLNETSTLEAIDTQIKRLQAMKKAKENNLKRFKDYVKSNMEKLNLPKIQTELGTINIVKSKATVEISNEDKIPAKYKTIKQEISIDKNAIAKDIKDGKEVKGATLIEDNTYLKIS